MPSPQREILRGQRKLRGWGMNWYGPRGDCGCCETFFPCENCADGKAPEVWTVEISGCDCSALNGLFEVPVGTSIFDTCDWDLDINDPCGNGTYRINVQVREIGGQYGILVRLILNPLGGNFTRNRHGFPELASPPNCLEFNNTVMPWLFGGTDDCDSEIEIRLTAGPVP